MYKSLLAGCCLLATLLPAAAQTDPAAEQLFLQQLGQQLLLPRYQAVADSSQALADSVAQLCRQPDKAALADSRRAWLQAYRQWLAVAPLNWGPSAELRSQRLIAFRPARPALIEAAVAQQLGASAEHYEEAGAAAKGYNAIEYALYQRSAELNQPARCQWLQRNAAEIAAHTLQLLAQWQQFAASLPLSGSAGAAYASSSQPVEEVVNLTLAGLNELHKELSRLGGLKPEQIPGQRSASGKQQQLAQFSLLQAVLLGADQQGGLARLAAQQQPALAATLRQQVAAVAAGLQQLPEQLAQPDAARRAQPAVAALASLMDTLEGPLTQALDITLSFNESDGD